MIEMKNVFSGLLLLALLAGSVSANLAVSANQIVEGQPVRESACGSFTHGDSARINPYQQLCAMGAGRAYCDLAREAEYNR